MIVQATLLIECVLFILRQISPRVFLVKACPEKNSSEAHLFTLVAYSGMYIFSLAEAFIIHMHIYMFFFCEHKVVLPPSKFIRYCADGFKDQLKTKLSLFFLTLIIMLVLSLSVFVLGVLLEIRHGHDVNCHGYVYEHHTVLWILDVIRCIHDVVIRLLMFLATVAIGNIWLGRKMKTDTNSDNEDYLEDRTVVSKFHELRMNDYDERGEKVKLIQDIFEAWFALPWIHHLINNSLNSNYILRAWKDENYDEAEFDFSEVTFLVQNLNQLFLLALPFFCSRKMNAYHREYRNQQLQEYESASKMALASMSKIEKKDHFDFIPCICTCIEFQVESSLFGIFLVFETIFTLIEAMKTG